ncbi:ribonuclease P protein subunit p40-like [Epargyreus clarus]|uniref:ribonuclease P protein subunit p40-like n=1 Tax=Epargyreus clarus TaxID=520877 RepID=UPI003C2B8FCE
MLCPEVSNFPPPKVYSFQKQNESIEKVTNLIQMNNFYKSVIITCPDELSTDFVQDIISEDSDYYRISNCSLTEFVDRDFIEYFVKNGKVTCLSADKNCIVQNCVAITPDGVLTLHILEFIYQTLGLEGCKRPHNYYEVKIDLKSLKHFEKMKNVLSKLELSDYFLSWEPHNHKVCPSSIAKYFCDRKISVSVHSITFTKISPEINQVPTLVDAEIDEVVEWMGMLAHQADINPTEDYISTYIEPECETPIKTTRISILVAKGFITPTTLNKVSQCLTEYVASRELENYWVAMSIQGNEESLWQFSPASPRMFQSHNCSCNIFFTQNGCTVYSIGQLKYS